MGNAQAQNKIAIFYERGTILEKNSEKALLYYNKAADKGNTHAMNNLANKYYKGEGVEKNIEIAVKNLNLNFLFYFFILFFLFFFLIF